MLSVIEVPLALLTFSTSFYSVIEVPLALLTFSTSFYSVIEVPLALLHYRDAVSQCLSVTALRLRLVTCFFETLLHLGIA